VEAGHDGWSPEPYIMLSRVKTVFPCQEERLLSFRHATINIITKTYERVILVKTQVISSHEGRMVRFDRNY
jgi:hypothetical protein